MNIARMEENKEKNGIELYFTVYPLRETKARMKNNGFRWNHKKSCWYVKRNDNALEIAKEIAAIDITDYNRYAQDDEHVTQVKATNQAIPERKEKAKVNKFGVQVGTYFCASWGYEQTNVNYFQVVELVGETSVRIKEVHPPIIESKACGGMAEDRVYKLDKGTLLPPDERSIFIKDNEKGDLKRIKSYAADGVSNAQIRIDDVVTAYMCYSDEEKQYVSWYA